VTSYDIIAEIILKLSDKASVLSPKEDVSHTTMAKEKGDIQISFHFKQVP
jgi:hypothetical protein